MLTYLKNTFSEFNAERAKKAGRYNKAMEALVSRAMAEDTRDPGRQPRSYRTSTPRQQIHRAGVRSQTSRSSSSRMTFTRASDRLRRAYPGPDGLRAEHLNARVHGGHQRGGEGAGQEPGEGGGKGDDPHVPEAELDSHERGHVHHLSSPKPCHSRHSQVNIRH